MPSLLEMWNEMQGLKRKYNSITQMKFENYTIKYEMIRPGMNREVIISNRMYCHSKEFEKEYFNKYREVMDEYEVEGGTKKRGIYHNTGKPKSGIRFFGKNEYEEIEEYVMNIINAKNIFYEVVLPDIYNRYEITKEEKRILKEQYQLLKKQYPIVKLEQERQKAEEHLKMKEEKKAENKINRLKKQNDIKTFCECCNKEYASRNFKTHLESEKHKKNATDTDEV